MLHYFTAFSPTLAYYFEWRDYVHSRTMSCAIRIKNAKSFMRECLLAVFERNGIAIGQLMMIDLVSQCTL